MNDAEVNPLPGNRVAGRSATSRTGLVVAAFAAIVFFPAVFATYGWWAAGRGDLPLVTDREQWPSPLLETFRNSSLTDEDLASIELTPHADGWFLRMSATPTAVEYLTATLTPLDEAQGVHSPADLINRFWEELPHRWRNHKPSPNDRFYATRQWNLAEEGAFHYLARLNEEDQVALVRIGYNF